MDIGWRLSRRENNQMFEKGLAEIRRAPSDIGQKMIGTAIHRYIQEINDVCRIARITGALAEYYILGRHGE